MKKLFTVLLAAILILSFCACKKSDGGITGDLRGDISDTEVKDNDSQNQDENVNTPDREQDGKTDNADSQDTVLGFIHSYDAVIFDGEDATKDTSNAFIKALKEADADKLSELCGGNPELYSFLAETEIGETNAVRFTFTDDKADEEETKNNRIPMCKYASFYALSLDITKVPENGTLKQGNGIYLLKIEPENGIGCPITLFCSSDKVSYDDFFMLQQPDNYDKFIREFSASYCKDQLTVGKNDPSALDLSKDVHFITHIMAYFTNEYPPYSFDEVNGFISKVFSGNPGLKNGDIYTWALTAGDDLPDQPGSTDKILGCSYAHGATTFTHKITDIRKDGTSAVYTVEYYGDYAGLIGGDIYEYYFDEQDGIPVLSGIALVKDSGIETAAVSF